MTAEDPGEARQGRNRLARFQTFLDVVYAVLFVDFLQYLPQTEDMKWEVLPYGLLSLLVDNSTELLRLLIAVGLTLISWNLTHKLLGPLARTNQVHTALILLQLVFVCMFFFFAVADPTLNSLSSPIGQSICLAISGFIGILGFAYAKRKDFVDPEISDEQKVKLPRRALLEPITALLNTPLAFFGPGFWTLGWFLIPIGVAQILKRVPAKRSA